MNVRKENDALGDVAVPSGSYGGSFYVRSKQNFQISDLRAPQTYRKALCWIKMAAAEVNAELGRMDEDAAEAIVQAGHEFIDGKFEEDFDLDAYQAGAGTGYNMNLNEILANRANELMGSEKGKYSPVHPNDHVNMSQSSNDVTPTALRIATLLDLEKIMRAGRRLADTLAIKGKEFAHHKKVGRTHLQDAVPVTLGDEFGAYAFAVERSLERIEKVRGELEHLGLGGSATGSGINVHPEFPAKVCQRLSTFAGLRLRPADNTFETTHSMAAFLAISAALRSIAVELMRIANDLRMMSSGPHGGLHEISLPEVQPGSSIMPGKINPSVPECMSMICVQVMGLDHSICMAAQRGEFELNWYTPLIMWDLLHQIEILGNGMIMFGDLCVSGITANEEDMQEVLGKSTATATALTPHMGYHEVAKLVQEAISKGVPFETLVPDEFKKYLE
jgi:aspartate ammonia-lyase